MARKNPERTGSDVTGHKETKPSIGKNRFSKQTKDNINTQTHTNTLF